MAGVAVLSLSPSRDALPKRTLKIALSGHIHQPPRAQSRAVRPPGPPGSASGHVTPRDLHPGAGQEAPSGRGTGAPSTPMGPGAGRSLRSCGGWVSRSRQRDRSEDQRSEETRARAGGLGPALRSLRDGTWSCGRAPGRGDGDAVRLGRAGGRRAHGEGWRDGCGGQAGGAGSLLNSLWLPPDAAPPLEGAPCRAGASRGPAEAGGRWAARSPFKFRPGVMGSHQRTSLSVDPGKPTEGGPWRRRVSGIAVSSCGPS